MIWEALKRDSDGSVEDAIKEGIISWHGLPFTSHTELMNKDLFEYGLSFAQRLDERFGCKTTAAKMTDVPGHTIGMVPLLNERGIRFLHIGVNEATPLPKVPPVFRWRCGMDEIVVMYENSYGENIDLGDFVVCFAHTLDNTGPQSVENIISLYEDLAVKYPGYELKAATLNDVADRILQIKNLPVIDKEIGDTWIHGAATDPKKLGMYRELLRYMEENNITSDKMHEIDLSDNLLLVPEHTWGMNIRTQYPDTENWGYKELKKTPEYLQVEESWKEQRNYLVKAESVLGVSVDYRLEEPDLTGFIKKENKEFDDKYEISWQLFDRSDYERYIEKYVVLTPENKEWAMYDYTKYGLPDYKGGIFKANVVECYNSDNAWWCKLEFDVAISEKYGLPYFWVYYSENSVDIRWFNKKADRHPQAFWFKCKGLEENWHVSKMGHWINPKDAIGSPLIMGTDKGVRNNDVTICSLDAALVAPFGRRLLDFELNPQTDDLYFNLYNNIWNTNFPMWYSDDTRFRFEFLNNENVSVQSNANL